MAIRHERSRGDSRNAFRSYGTVWHRSNATLHQELSGNELTRQGVGSEGTGTRKM